MKTLILVILAVLFASPAIAGTVTLGWGASNNADGYHVYTDGVKGAAITGTESSVTVPAGAHSFYVTAYNAWGESSPSNTVTTPPLATPPGSLRIVVFVDVQK